MLKLVVLLAIALTVSNAQCLANCSAVPCPTQDDPNLPPCHQQHHQHQQQHQSDACAQPAALDNAAPVAQPLVAIGDLLSAISIGIEVQRYAQSFEPHSPPDSTASIPLALRI